MDTHEQATQKGLDFLKENLNALALFAPELHSAVFKTIETPSPESRRAVLSDLNNLMMDEPAHARVALAIVSGLFHSNEDLAQVVEGAEHLIRHGDETISIWAAGLFIEQSMLSVPSLVDALFSTPAAAGFTLSHLSASRREFPETMIVPVAANLTSEDPEIRMNTLFALSNAELLPNRVIVNIARLLSDEDRHVSSTATYVLASALMKCPSGYDFGEIASVAKVALAEMRRNAETKICRNAFSLSIRFDLLAPDELVQAFTHEIPEVRGVCMSAIFDYPRKQDIFANEEHLQALIEAVSIGIGSLNQFESDCADDCINKLVKVGLLDPV